MEVYKLHRLPGSPPGELAILKEVSAALPGHSMEEEDTPDAPKQPNPKDSHPPQGRPPQKERENLLDRSLATVYKVHQKALSATAALEEELERLHQMKACSGSKQRRNDRDRQEPGERRKKRQCQVSLSSQPVTS